MGTIVNTGWKLSWRKGWPSYTR